jgi:uncharacterized protein (DUF1684 family)
MKKRLGVWLSAALTAWILASCGQSGATFDVAAHTNEVLEWRSGRIERLKDPGGYLIQIGLYWLETGTYSFGSDDLNDIVFGGDGAPSIGVFTVDNDGVSMATTPGVVVQSDGENVSEIAIAADTTDEGVMVTHRSLAWSVVERIGRYAIRLRDFDHPFVATFGPLPYFDIDAGLRVEARLRRYAEPRIANVGTVIEGLDYRPESPGLVEFEIDGEIYELEAYTSGEDLFYVFGDLTNRDATYGAGRFLYSTTPGEDGLTVLDFNKSYSPPCAFNDFATCPVASPRNRLPIRIEAGEKFDMSFHYSPDH